MEDFGIFRETKPIRENESTRSINIPKVVNIVMLVVSSKQSIILGGILRVLIYVFSLNLHKIRRRNTLTFFSIDLAGFAARN